MHSVLDSYSEVKLHEPIKSLNIATSGIKGLVLEPLKTSLLHSLIKNESTKNIMPSTAFSLQEGFSALEAADYAVIGPDSLRSITWGPDSSIYKDIQYHNMHDIIDESGGIKTIEALAVPLSQAEGKAFLSFLFSIKTKLFENFIEKFEPAAFLLKKSEGRVFIPITLPYLKAIVGPANSITIEDITFAELGVSPIFKKLGLEEISRKVAEKIVEHGTSFSLAYDQATELTPLYNKCTGFFALLQLISFAVAHHTQIREHVLFKYYMYVAGISIGAVDKAFSSIVFTTSAANIPIQQLINAGIQPFSQWILTRPYEEKVQAQEYGLYEIPTTPSVASPSPSPILPSSISAIPQMPAITAISSSSIVQPGGIFNSIVSSSFPVPLPVHLSTSQTTTTTIRVKYPGSPNGKWPEDEYLGPVQVVEKANIYDGFASLLNSGKYGSALKYLKQKIFDLAPRMARLSVEFGPEVAAEHLRKLFKPFIVECVQLPVCEENGVRQEDPVTFMPYEDIVLKYPCHQSIPHIFTLEGDMGFISNVLTQLVSDGHGAPAASWDKCPNCRTPFTVMLSDVNALKTEFPEN